MNSQITFEEYLLLSQKWFIYEMTYNPTMVYELQLDELNPNIPGNEESTPEFYAQT